MELHPKEKNLIILIRTRFQWGDVSIETRDGLPNRIMKAHDWTQISSEDTLEQ